MDVESTRERAKRRTERIPLGYLDREDCVDPNVGRRARIALVAGALAAGAAFFVATFPVGNRFASRGPVVSAHAGFEKDCKRCHRPETADFGWLDAQDSPPPHFHAADAACAQCHIASPHFAHANLDGNEASCMSCHREHIGRSADLKRTTDANCAACHADPTGWSAVAGVDMNGARKADAFAVGRHPEFASTAGADQKLRFNHAVHLAPGLGVDLVYGKVAPGNAPLAGKKADAVVQLDCSSCHERAGGSGPNGDYRPVTYDRHCAACHRLEAPVYAAEKASTERIASFEIPHGIDGARLRDWIVGAYSKQALEGNLSLRQALVQDKKVASAFVGRPALKHESENVVVRAEATVRNLFASARGCGECHVTEPRDAAASFALKVAKTGVPARWWGRAKFSHAAHSNDCASCHRTPDGAPVAKSESSADVLMPKLQDCIACHESNRTTVRSDCVLCHGYHGVGRSSVGGPPHRLTPKGGEVRR